MGERWELRRRENERNEMKETRKRDTSTNRTELGFSQGWCRCRSSPGLGSVERGEGEMRKMRERREREGGS